MAAYESREGVKDRGESNVITNLCFKIGSSRELKIEDHRKRRTFSGTVLRTNANPTQRAERPVRLESGSHGPVSECHHSLLLIQLSFTRDIRAPYMTSIQA